MLKYAYEQGGMQDPTSPYIIKLNQDISVLSVPQIKQLLQDDGATLSSRCRLSRYDPDTSAYITLDDSSEYEIGADNFILIKNPQHTTIQEIKERITLLTRLIEESSSGQSPPLEKAQSIRISNKTPRLDMAYFYSCPLMYMEGGVLHPYNTSSLDFENEKRQFLKVLREKEIKIHGSIQPCTIKSLTKIQKYSPKILIFSVTGFIPSNNSQEFFIAFEDDQQTGMLNQVSAETLSNFVPNYANIVIVKGQYARKLGHVFYDAGFDCVLCIQESTWKLDSYGRTEQDNNQFGRIELEYNQFNAEFIKYLLDGQTIGDAYNNALDVVKQQYDLVNCCCAHSHKPSCLWWEESASLSQLDMHIKHCFACSCIADTALVIKCQHKNNCQAALQFSMEYNLDSIEETNVVCCCSHEVDHGNLKFQILSRDTNILEQVLFRKTNRERNLELFIDLPIAYNLPYSHGITVGRHKDIFTILHLLGRNRCIQIIGSLAKGKTTVARWTAQYIYERKIMKDGVAFLNFRGKASRKDFFQFIIDQLHLIGVYKKKQLCEYLRNKKLLLVCDNIEVLVAKDEEWLRRSLHYIISNTVGVKILLLCSRPIQIMHSVDYELDDLSAEYRESLLKLLLGRKLLAKIKREPELFKNNPRLLDYLGRTPSEIIAIVPRIMQVGIETIIQEFNSRDNLQNEQHVRRLANFTSFIPQLFVQIIQYFPSGIHDLNLRFLCEKFNLPFSEIRSVIQKSMNETHGEWFFHYNDNILQLKSAVQNQLLEEIQPEPQIAEQCLIYLAAFTRAILRVIMQQSILGLKYRNLLIFVNAGIGGSFWGCKHQLCAELEFALQDTEIEFQSMIQHYEGNF